jgi:16S rRNA (guanine527-N7)-methyltransferase
MAEDRASTHGANDADAGSGAARDSARERFGGVPILPAREPLPTRVEGLPELPPEYGLALESGLEELGIDLPVPARTAIDDHVRLLLTWTAAINLTAIRDPAEVARAHVLDSLTGLAPLRERGIDRFLDLGSGGGFPGLPLALALPAERALLVEPVAKKARFLETVATMLAAPSSPAPGHAPPGHAPPGLEVAIARAEALAQDPAQRGRWPAVTVRAVANLADLVELSFPLLAPDGVLVAWKRGEIVDEVAAAQRAIHALGGGTVASVEPHVRGLEGHRLVVVTSRGRVPPGYPRDPAARKRRPW